VQFFAEPDDSEAEAEEAKCNSEPHFISLQKVSVGSFRNFVLSFAPPFGPVRHKRYESMGTTVKQECVRFVLVGETSRLHSQGSSKLSENGIEPIPG
jgi:hypothetical protein